MIGNKNGFTLIEIIVATAIFSIAASAISAFFVTGIRGHRNAVAQQNLVDNTRFALEQMARQIRMAVRDETGACSGDAANRLTFKVSGNSLTFLDYRNPSKCVRYELSGGKILMYPDLGSQPLLFRDISSDDINITKLEFLAQGGAASDGEQPRVTVALEAEAGVSAESLSRIQLQTTVSARNLDTP